MNDKMKRVLILLFLFLSSCTAAIWNEPKYRIEQLNGFYVNKDVHVLLASTGNQGYIFPISNELENILSLSRSILFHPVFKNFKIDRDHKVSGSVTLILAEKNISQNDFNKLKLLGFKSNKLQGDKLVYSVFLEGKQYEIDGSLPMLRLEHKYKITIEQPVIFSSTASKITATPATIVFDTVVVLPASFFLATLWIMSEN
ncbi:MAG: hypothetical protein JW902_13940 [Syntrophaceae bacterium]|nr:hypothetical protein [Syntrophaceae bacterium]